MKLHIARHGQASFDAPSDKERPLTPGGIEATKNLVERNHRVFAGAKVIWCSELLRAFQTASIFAEVLSIDIEQKDFLAPDSEPEELIKALSDESDELIIVSHQPLVGDVVSILSTGNILESHPYVTSEVVSLECELAQPGLAEILGGLRP